MVAKIAKPAGQPVLPAPPKGGTGGAKPAIADPVANWRNHVTSEAGTRVHPVTRKVREHHGIDIAVPKGTPVQSVKRGTVVFAGEQSGYGNIVEVKHEDGTLTKYAHLDAINAQVGQQVGAGDVIGKVGSTGVSTGDHLHFEVRRGGATLDPRAYLEGSESIAAVDPGPGTSYAGTGGGGSTLSLGGGGGAPSALSLGGGAGGGEAGGVGNNGSGGSYVPPMDAPPPLPADFQFPLDLETLARALGVSVEELKKSLPYIVNAMKEAGITDPNAIIGILATVKTEVGNFQPIAEHASGAEYNGRSDLGNTQPGDGERYKGRGFIQITGRANYREYGKKLGIDLEGNPDLALRPDYAAKILVQYFKDRGLDKKAAAGDWTGVRKGVNGGANGMDTFMATVNKLTASARQNTA